MFNILQQKVLTKNDLSNDWGLSLQKSKQAKIAAWGRNVENTEAHTCVTFQHMHRWKNVGQRRSMRGIAGLRIRFARNELNFRSLHL